jgi:phosphatidylserine synthase
MTVLTTHAAWVLVVTFALSLIYEIYRTTAKAGTSRHDSTRAFLQGLVIYVVAAVVIAGLFAGADWAAWAGLVFSVVMIAISIFYYNPTIMVERRPEAIDWFEDLVFTGLLFVAAFLLFYEVAGYSLQT